MTAAVNLPLWTLGAAWLLICWTIIGIDALRKRQQECRASARRIQRLTEIRQRVLDELWSDEVGVGDGSARTSHSVSRGRPTDTSTYPDAA